MNFTIKTLARITAILILLISLILLAYGSIKLWRVETAETIFSNIQTSTPGVTVTSSLSEKTKNNAQTLIVGSIIGSILGVGGLILSEQLANSSSPSESQGNKDLQAEIISQNLLVDDELLIKKKAEDSDTTNPN